MASFAGALRALNEIKSHGVVTDYAVAGAMALVFWSEPIPTYDLDVLVWLVDQQTDQAVVNLGALYAWRPPMVIRLKPSTS